ncbi:hypothetical protein CIK05_13415 [Bdellovibrio sp. qaytius]|nr:hypothetical protein CIK05_13415 [Bdellovibrio sp. qaytius]
MAKQFNYKSIRSLLLLTLIGLSACQKSADEIIASVAAADTKVLYISTGSCNSGQGITTYTTTATRTIERYLASTGTNLGYLLDYNYSGVFIPATHPRTIIDNGSSLLILNENATTTSERRVIKVPKTDPLSYTNYYANSTAFSGILNGMYMDTEGSLIVGKTTALEKISPNLSRVLAGAAAWVNAPAGTCATSTTGMSSVVTLPPVSAGVAGKIIYAHQGATAALNRLGMMTGTGYYTAADCVNGVQISAVTHTKAANITQDVVAFNAVGTAPTSMILIPFSSGSVTAKLIVSYANAQTSNNNAGTYNLNHGIVSWDVTETSTTAGTLSNPVVLYDNTTYIFGISAMAYDSSTKSLFVASAGDPGAVNQTTNGYGYNVEKFSVDFTNAATTGLQLTRQATNFMPFIRGGANTKCISGLALGN